MLSCMTHNANEFHCQLFSILVNFSILMRISLRGSRCAVMNPATTTATEQQNKKHPNKFTLRSFLDIYVLRKLRRYRPT